MASRLSPKSVAILTLIADGRSYAQIVDAHPDLSYLDIFDAAREALGVVEATDSEPTRRPADWMEKIRDQYPKAYMPWSPEDDSELARLHASGVSVREIAVRFERQPSAIRARLSKLGLS